MTNVRRKIVDASQPAFKPRNVKKVQDSKYRDRAAERRVGDGNDYAHVRPMLIQYPNLRRLFYNARSKPSSRTLRNGTLTIATRPRYNWFILFLSRISRIHRLKPNGNTSVATASIPSSSKVLTLPCLSRIKQNPPSLLRMSMPWTKLF